MSGFIFFQRLLDPVSPDRSGLNNLWTKTCAFQGQFILSKPNWWYSGKNYRKWNLTSSLKKIFLGKQCSSPWKLKVINKITTFSTPPLKVFPCEILASGSVTTLGENCAKCHLKGTFLTFLILSPDHWTHKLCSSLSYHFCFYPSCQLKYEQIRFETFKTLIFRNEMFPISVCFKSKNNFKLNVANNPIQECTSRIHTFKLRSSFRCFWFSWAKRYPDFHTQNWSYAAVPLYIVSVAIKF